MISNAKETSPNENKHTDGRNETKGKSEKVNNSKEDDNVKGGFLWKMIGKIGIEPVVILMNLGWTMYWVQTANLYIEKTCKVGSFFFGNGTTFSNEVLFKDFFHKFFPLSFISFAKVCDNLFNGTFPEEQEYVQTVVANVEMVSNLIKQVILSSKSLCRISHLSSRFPASYLPSSLGPGVTEREGSR